MNLLLTLLLAPIAIVTMVIILIIGRFIAMLLRYHVAKPKYAHMIHCHSGKKATFLRVYSQTGEVLELMDEAYDAKNGQFYDITHQGMGLGGQHMVGICHPEDIKMFVSQPDLFAKPEAFDKLKDFTGNGLGNVEGEEWKRQRRILTPAFHLGFLKSLFSVMVRNADNLVGQLKASQGQAIEPLPLFGDTFMEIIINSSILEGDSAFDKPRVKQLFQRISDGIPTLFLSRFLFGKMDVYLPFEFANGPAKAKAQLDKVVTKLLVKRRQQAARDTQQQQQQSQSQSQSKKDTPSETGLGIYSREQAKDFVSLMLEADMCDSDVIDNVSSFLFAGHDTSSNLLAWCLYYLCKYPEYQKKLHTELSEGQFDHLGMTVEELERFAFLKAFIKESSRVRPPVFMGQRVTTKDVAMHDGTMIPKDTVVNLVFFYVHNDPRFWDRPKDFWPERFCAAGNVASSEENQTGERHPYSFIPFYAGPRNCIGQRFAMQALSLLLGTIVSKFELQADVDKVVIDSTLVISPRNLKVSFIPRN